MKFSCITSKSQPQPLHVLIHKYFSALTTNLSVRQILKMCNFLCHVLGLSGFEPGRISDNFMKRFDSPSVNDEVPVFRPKKKLLSFDQVMRRVSTTMNVYKNTLDSISCQLQSFQTPSSSDDVRQQRDMELDEVRNVRWKNISSLQEQKSCQEEIKD